MRDYKVHPSAVIDDGAQIGSGSRVWHFVHVCGGAQIGCEVSLGQNVYIGNKVIIGLLFSYISFYVAIKNYNLYLPFNNFFVMSASQLFCVPLTLFVLQKFNITVGAGEKYRLDKTNIYHVLLITFLSTIVLGALVVFTSIFYENQNGFLKFIIGHFLGGAVLIISMKLLVNLPTIFINFIKSS